MNRTEKDLYSILGVRPDVSQEELRQAYLRRARVIHPDRFDRQRQSEEWSSANEMLAELNSAYAVLRDPSSRASYDSGLEKNEDHQRSSTQPRQQASKGSTTHVEEFSAGSAVFDDLPVACQERLLTRQAGKNPHQVQVPTEGLNWKFGILLVASCWFAFLLFKADGPDWSSEVLVLYGTVTLIASLLVAWAVTRLIAWRRSHLKPFFYVTPLYFIRTELNHVSFWPLWSLDKLSVTHNYRNGVYSSTSIRLGLGARTEDLQILGEKTTDLFLAELRSYDDALRQAASCGDVKYFERHDDFAGVDRRVASRRPALVSWKVVYSFSILAAAASFLLALQMNHEMSKKYWFRHGIPRSIANSNSVQSASDGSQGLPAVTGPQDGGITSIEDLGRRLKKKYPGRLDDVSDRELGQRLKARFPDALAEIPDVEPEGHPVLPLPDSGSVQSFYNRPRIAPLTIKTGPGDHYLVKVVDASTGDAAMTIFVRASTTVEVDIPEGVFELRYAMGTSWYGYEYLFGSRTRYSKADQLFEFGVVGDQVRGYEVTLYRVNDGNLVTSEIAADEF